MASVALRAATSVVATAGVGLIDTHVHMADVSSFDYSFVRMFPDLARSWTMSDFVQETASVSSDLTGILLMQLDKVNSTSAIELEEAAFYQRIADECDADSADAGKCIPVLGIVAGAPVHEGATAVEEHLHRLLDVAPKTKAVREAIWKKGADYFLSDAFVGGLGAVARKNLTFDLLVKNWQLQDIVALVKLVPDLRFNLNHIGYPSISNATAESDAKWREDISALAAHPNVFCKLSGLPQTYGKMGWVENWETILPYVRHVIQAFGARRVNFAGNWFVLNHDSWNACTGKYDCDAYSYRHMVNLVHMLMESLELSAEELLLVFSGTAVNLYSLDPSLPAALI